MIVKSLFYFKFKPETLKLNQIIVKTANFVVQNGLQMEILLKTKQSSNTQFDFLNFDNFLNRYYKHIQFLIRERKIDPLDFLAEPQERNSLQISNYHIKNKN
jgi:hypothetical protein